MTTITAFGEADNPKVRKARLEFEALTPRRQAQYEAAVDCGADHEDAMEAAMRLAD
jgi:hypothetical protein